MKLKGPWRKSKIRMAWICSWLAYAIFELGLTYNMSKAAILGITIHAIIAHELAKIIGHNNPDYYLNSHEIEITEEAYELAYQAIENLPIIPSIITDLELGMAIDKKGQKSKSPQHDWLTGKIDIRAKDGSRIIVLDHKTGRLKYDDVFERHDYVNLAKVYSPEIKEISFGRYWTRYEDTDWYHYRWERKGRGKQKLFIDDVEHDSRFLYAYIKEKIEHAESLEVVPNPGEHCENLYGEPCPFLGNECPLAQKGDIVPAVFDITTLRQDASQYLATLEPEYRVAAAFRMLLQGLPDDQITPEIADLAKQGIAHVRNGATKVNARLKELADRMCFQSGGKWHGLKSKKTVDVEAALSILIGRDTSLKEMAKACSVSVTGINSMSVGLEDTKQVLFETCVDDAGGEEFGPIKRVE